LPIFTHWEPYERTSTRWRRLSAQCILLSSGYKTPSGSSPRWPSLSPLLLPPQTLQHHELQSLTVSRQPAFRCKCPNPFPLSATNKTHRSLTTLLPLYRVRGRPHYYSSKKEEYAIIKFSLDADLSTLFTWNTKQLFVYITAEWPSTTSYGATITSNATTNQAVIWDSIITSPSADHLSNLGPVSMKKLRRSAQGKSIDPSR